MNNSSSQNQTKKSIYRWVVFGACFLMVFVSLGFGSGTKGTYLTAITNQLGLERAKFTVNDSMRYLTTALLNFFFGALVKKLGARKMIGFGFLFLVMSFTVYSFATAYWHFYIGGALLGAGLAWTTTTIVGHVVEKWFAGNKGTIMGVILAANGLGGVASEQIVTRIIYGMNGELTDEFSRWRLAYQISAILFAVVGVLVVLLVRNKPEDMGLPSAGAAVKSGSRGRDWPGRKMNEILKKPYFYVMGLCVFCTGFILQSMSNVSKPNMYDVGLSKNYVIMVFSVHALFLMISKISVGVGFDKFGLRITFGICCACSLISMVSLAYVSPERSFLSWVYSVVSSFGMPLETVMIPLLVLDMFGSESFSKVMGYYLAFNTLGYALGVPLANLAYDLYGTYFGFLIAMAVLMTVVSVVAQLCIHAAGKDRERFLAKEASGAR